MENSARVNAMAQSLSRKTPTAVGVRKWGWNDDWFSEADLLVSLP